MIWIHINNQGGIDCMVNEGNRPRQGNELSLFCVYEAEVWEPSSARFFTPLARQWTSSGVVISPAETKTFSLGNPSMANSYFLNGKGYLGKAIKIPAEATAELNGGHLLVSVRMMYADTTTFGTVQNISIDIEPTFGKFRTTVTQDEFNYLVDQIDSFDDRFLPLAGGTITGHVDFNNTIEVTGDAQFDSGVQIDDGLSVYGNSTFSNNVTITGDLNVTGTTTLDSLEATDATISGNLEVAGTTTLDYLNVSEIGVGSISADGTIRTSESMAAVEYRLYTPDETIIKLDNSVGDLGELQFGIPSGDYSPAFYGSLGVDMWDGREKVYPTVKFNYYDANDEYESTEEEQIATQQWSDARYLKITGGIVTGNLSVNGRSTFVGDVRVQSINGIYVEAGSQIASSGGATFVWSGPASFSGSETHAGNATFSNNVRINAADPTEAYHAVRKDYVDNLIASVKTNAFQVVQSLPQTGEEGIIYLVPKANTDYYTQYIWEGNSWLNIGDTQIDLSGYLPLTGGTITGDLNVQGNAVFSNNVTISASAPTQASHATRKDYVDSISAKITEITWSDLKALRDGGNLVPGRQYRITDYQCTTNQSGTSSAGHQFDIIVTADDANTLNENARACLHEGDTYFANSKLEAWKLKYCLDNDNSRFNWANSTNGKGVVYRMIDEFDNDVPYDFKNILFTKNNVYTNVYTFSHTQSDTVKDASVSIATLANIRCSRNVIKASYFGAYNRRTQLNFTVFYSAIVPFTCHDNVIGEENYNNTFISDDSPLVVYGNSIGSYFIGNTISSGFIFNVIGEYMASSTFGVSFQRSTIKNHCERIVAGNGLSDISIGNDCSYITFGDSSSAIDLCENIIIDNGCKYLYINSADADASGSNPLQNVHIHLGVTGSSSANRLTITVPDRNLPYETSYEMDGSTKVVL